MSDLCVEGLLSDWREVGHAEGSRKEQVRVPFPGALSDERVVRELCIINPKEVFFEIILLRK